MFSRIARFLPFAVLSLVASYAFAAETTNSLVLDPRVGLNAYAALVEQEFASARNGLQTLASTEDAGSGDWDRIKGPLTQFAEGMPISSAVWFARPDGSYFTVEKGPADQNLSNRDYFPRLMAGKAVAGDLVIGKSTGARSTIIAVPVQKDGHVTGALGVSVAMEKVAALVDEKLDLPKNVMFYALDQHGQVALHRQPTLLFEFAQQLGSPSLAEAVKEMLTKPEGVVHYDFEGAPRQAIFKRSSATGWVYALRW